MRIMGPPLQTKILDDLIVRMNSPTFLSLVPRPLPKEGRGPGIHCLRMRETTPGGSYNSVPYRRLYLWTVRERPFYCLGVALRVRPPVVKVFSTAVVYARITLFRCVKLSFACRSA